MRTVTEHQAAVAELLRSLLATRDAESVPLLQALHRVLAGDFRAPVALPPFDNSQMDGYAVRSVDSGNSLPALAAIAAGQQADTLPRGSTVPIMTGAMLPDGADAVVPVEAAQPSRFVAAGEPVLLPDVPLGQFVRRAGSDVAIGTLALAGGTRLGPAQLGLLGALGLASVPVLRRITVAVLSTGDELTAPGVPLQPGRIYDANSTLLAAALTEAGAEAVVLPTLPDNPAGLRAVLDGLTGVDLLISTGGISQGAFEVVKQGLAGAAEFHQVAMQPGGPQAIGSVKIGDGQFGADRVIPFLGFPGNPVSTLISFEMFLRPLLAGARNPLRARINAAVASPAARHQVRRGRFAQGTVELLGGPGSHLLHAMAHANALLHFPVGVAELAAGEEVEVWLL